jgi:monoamine oxidase
MQRGYRAAATAMLREAHAAATESHISGAPIGEVTQMRAERRAGLRRRHVLAGLGGAALGALGAPFGPARAAGNVPSVIIVGGGLAGLCCARALWQRGIAAPVYEWDGRVGGRVNTLRGLFNDGIYVEEHGEFISSEHVRMRALVRHYGLQLVSVGVNLHGTANTGWYGGQRYTQAQLNADWQSYAWQLFHDAVLAAPGATYKHANATARAWDHMSVVDWVQRYIPGGTDNPLGGLCLADVISEYGSPPDRQSALNLLYILGYDTSRAGGYQPRNTPVVAGTDEQYQVVGGNDQIVAGLVGDLPQGSIYTGYQLLAVRETAHRGFVCTFQNGAGTVEVSADHVVLTLPPPPLRDVDLSKVTLGPLQQRCIAAATLGNNAKIYMQFDGTPWISAGYNGNTLTDVAACGCWDAANQEPGGYGRKAQGVLAVFPGGKPGATLAQRYGIPFGDDVAQAPPALIADTLAQLEPILPGLTAGWQAGPHIAWCCDGNINEHFRGAYSNFLVGQYTSICGAQSLRAGNLHFAGEHTSVEFQGFMEGAVQSGLRAAAEI